jgi:hypothetical protein
MLDVLAQRAVQRSVQPCVSMQYQRTSLQALPPSGTMWSAGWRVPHSQHVSTMAGPARAGDKRSP